MKTMRTMAATAVTTIGALAMVGCGGSPSAPHTPSAAPSARPAATAAAASTEPLSEWLPSATAILDRLTADLHGLTGVMTTDPSAVPGDPGVARLKADAQAGLALPAPAGNAATDAAWDTVMTDYSHAAVALSEGNLTQAVTDLDSATTDTVVLQAELPTAS
jgi:hypothetical protein